MKNILLFVFISLPLFQNIFSQTDFRKGYIISNENDTIYGLIDYRENIKKYKICDFKSSENQNVISYDPSQIKGYRYINDKYYISKEISENGNSSEKVFYEVLVKGTATLYKYLSSIFVEKNDENFIKLTNELQIINNDGKEFYKYSNRHIAVLSYLLADCPSIKGKINKVKNIEIDLTKLIELYNECIGDQSITFKENKPWFKTQIGVAIGMNSSKINLDSPHEETDHITEGSDNINSIMPGLYIDLSSPRIHERIALHFGINYLSSTYKSFYIIESTFETDRSEIKFDLKQLMIPLGFRYTFYEKKFTPYLNLGIFYTLHLESSSLWTLEYEKNKVIQFYEREPLSIDDNQIGLWGGIGVKKSILKSLNGFMEIRYEYAESMFKIEGPQGYKSIDHNLINFQVLIGLSL